MNKTKLVIVVHNKIFFEIHIAVKKIISGAEVEMNIVEVKVDRIAESLKSKKFMCRS